MSVQCNGCGATLSDQFVRVFYLEDQPVNECIHCPDKRSNNFQPPAAHDNTPKI